MACLDGDHQCGSKVGLKHRHKNIKDLCFSLGEGVLGLVSENVFGGF